MTAVFRLSTQRLRDVVFCISVFCFAVTGVESADLQSPETLVETIHQGGYVLYMRHAASNRSQIDADTVNLDDCSRQRNLSAEGRAQAQAIGEAIRALDIPIGSVTASPYCRCIDTARLAFGHADNSDDLRFTISADKQETQRLADALKVLLSTVPADGTNSVLVAHTGNLREAADVWPKPEGVIHVFRPMGEQGFEHFGSITPDQWPALTQVE